MATFFAFQNIFMEMLINGNIKIYSYARYGVIKYYNVANSHFLGPYP